MLNKSIYLFLMLTAVSTYAAEDSCLSELLDNRDDIRVQVCKLVNIERTQAGLGPIKLERVHSISAQKHAKDMQDFNYFSHSSRDGRSPFDRMEEDGISYMTAAENIAQGQRSAEQVVKAWMNSPGHRMNILEVSYRKMGIGFIANGFYWVQNFTD